MTIIAIGTPQALKQVQREQGRIENPSLKLVEDMKATPQDAPFEVWNGHAAEMQKINYVRVWLDAFYLFRNSPKGFTALRQKVVSGAVAECLEKFASKHYFESDRLERTLKRIGAIYMLAQKDKREHHVRFAFAPLLSSHGIDVPDYLKPQIAVTNSVKSKREERHERGRSERPSRGAVEMFKNAPAPVKIAMRTDGTTYVVKAKHKPIVALTSEERAAREKAAVAERQRKADLAAKKAAEKEKNKKKQGGKKK